MLELILLVDVGIGVDVMALAPAFSVMEFLVSTARPS